MCPLSTHRQVSTVHASDQFGFCRFVHQAVSSAGTAPPNIEGKAYDAELDTRVQITQNNKYMHRACRYQPDMLDRLSWLRIAKFQVLVGPCSDQVFRDLGRIKKRRYLHYGICVLCPPFLTYLFLPKVETFFIPGKLFVVQTFKHFVSFISCWQLYSIAPCGGRLGFGLCVSQSRNCCLACHVASQEVLMRIWYAGGPKMKHYTP